METIISPFRHHPWLVYALPGLAALWVLSLFLVRRATLKRFRAALQQEDPDGDDLEIRLPDPHPQDQEALALIKDYRRRHLLKIGLDTRLSFREISELAQSLVAAVARVYYPEEERPELKASLADLVALYRRVGVRLAAWLEAAPIRPLKDMELTTVLLLHDTYQRVKEHPVHQFLKRYHLYRAAHYVWGAVNVVNPYYWGRRAAYKGTREFLARMFLAKVVAVVGEEAMRLYSRRSPNLRLFRRYLVGLQEMINLSLEAADSLPREVILLLMKSVLKARGLEDQEKVALLKSLAQPRVRETGLADLSPDEQQAVRSWLAGLVKAGWQGRERQEFLARVRERFQEVATELEPGS